MLSTLLFCLLCAFGAGMVYWHRPGTVTQRDDPHMLWAIVFSALVGLLMWVGDSNGYGKRLTLDTQELRVPLQDAKEDGVYFVVGPHADKSDLVVGPYADASQSEEVYREELDSALTIRRDGQAWQACGRTVPQDDAANLPGMAVVFDDVEVVGEECRDLGETPLKALIQRKDTDGIQKRRHLDLSLTDSYVRIGFPADESLVTYLGRCSDMLGNKDGTGTGNDRLRLAPAGLHGDDLGYRVPRNLVINQLGQGGKRPFLVPQSFGPIGEMARLCGLTEQALQWPADDASARLIMTSRRTAMSWWIVGLVLFCTLATARICQVHWREGRGRTEGALVIALQWLLTLRLLVAMSGFPNDPSLSLSSVLWPPAMAMACVPVLAIALLRCHVPGGARALALLGLQVPLAGTFIAYSLDQQMPGTQELALAFITLLLLCLRTVVRSPQPLIYLAGREVAAVTRRIGVAIGRRAHAAGKPVSATDQLADRLQLPEAGQDERAGGRLFVAGLVLTLAITAMRFAVAAVGKLVSPAAPAWQERFNGIPVIENLPISLIYVPLAIIGMAMMIAGYRKAPGLNAAVLMAGAFAAAFLGIALWVRDLGLILIFALPVAWAIAKLAAAPMKNASWHSQLARLVLLGPLVSPFFLIGGFYWWNATDVPSPGADLAGHMEQASNWDANLVRLQRFVDPDPLIAVGNTQAMGMLDQAAQLEPITAQAIGKGYMEPSGIVRPLLLYQYSDNLLAVQIAWPFGRIGLAVLLLALLVTLLALRRNVRADAPNAWLIQAGDLAAMILFWSGAYMALANLNLVPFTGRNFYLLAARSMGDLAEGLVLFIMVALPSMVMPSAGDPAMREERDTER